MQLRINLRHRGRHPLRLIRQVTDSALKSLSDQFDAAYAQ
jgi:hypothetical protein